MNYINAPKPKITKPNTDNVLVDLLRDLQKKKDFALLLNDFDENLDIFLFIERSISQNR